MPPNHTRETTAIPSVTYVYPAFDLRPADGRSYRNFFSIMPIYIHIYIYIFRFEENARNGYKTRCNVIVHTIYTHMPIHRDTQVETYSFVR